MMDLNKSSEDDCLQDNLSSQKSTEDDQPSYKSSEDEQPSHQKDPVTPEMEEAAQQIGELHLGKTTVRPVTWSDEIFIEKFLRMALVSDKVTIVDAIPAAKALLNWYVHGIKPNYSSDTILFVFYAMTINNSRHEYNEEKIFPSILMEGETSLQKPDEVEKIEEIKYTSPIRWRFKTDNSSQLKSLKKNTSTAFNTVNFIEQAVKDWYAKLWEALDQNPDAIDEENKKKQQQAINLIGFLYMNLQRLAIKNKIKVCEHLVSRAFDSFFNILGILEDRDKIVDKIIPPTSTMVSDFVNDYKRYSPNSMRCLAAMVFAYGRSDEHRFLYPFARILSAGCLHTLQLVDLGIVRWGPKSISSKKNMYYNMMQYMNAEKHRETNLALLDFTKCALNPKEFSWYWAKMFSDEAFPGLNIKDNPEYAMTMFSYFNGNDPKNPLWDTLFARFDSTGKMKRAALRMGIHIQLNAFSKMEGAKESQKTLELAYEMLLHESTRRLKEIDDDSS